MRRMTPTTLRAWASRQESLPSASWAYMGLASAGPLCLRLCGGVVLQEAVQTVRMRPQAAAAVNRMVWMLAVGSDIVFGMGVEVQ